MKNSLWTLLVGILGAFIGVAVYTLVVPPKQIIVHENRGNLANLVSEKDVWLSGALQRKFVASTPNDFTSAASNALPAVVFIRASQESDSRFGFPSKNSASGVIISEDGYIVTNNHVVENSSKIEITLNDNRQYEAKLIGTDPSTDLALLKVTESNLPFIRFGNSDSLSIGEWVMAVGNPFGLQSTVTAGIISAKGRDIKIIENEYRIEAFLQTDAAVNPGNSGGALINTNGELIGINTAIMTKSGRYEGFSFAVPGNLALKIIGDLKAYGKVKRGILGVNIRNLDMQLAREMNKKSLTDLLESIKLPNSEGVFVLSVRPQSGAEKSGMKDHDIILEVNQTKTASVADLQEKIGRLKPGDLVKVKLWRKGQMVETTVELKELKTGTEEVAADGLFIQPEKNDEWTDAEILASLGLSVNTLTAEETKRYKTSGVRVIDIDHGSLAYEMNMARNYVITYVNKKAIKSETELAQAIRDADSEIILEGVYENIKDNYVYKFHKKQLGLY